VDLLWRDQANKSHHNSSILADISVSGAAVRTLTPVPVGAKVFFDYDNQKLVGKVKHCARKDGAFVLGIEFVDGCEWTQSQQ
jgi:hypothetical protein